MEKLRSFCFSQIVGPALPITQSQRSQTRSSSSSVFQEQDLGRVILNLAFSATIALVVLFLKEGSLMGQVEPPISLRLLAIAILMAFLASFLAISLHRILPTFARAWEHIGIVSTVVAFFLLMGFLLPSNFMWVVLVASIVSLLAYVGAHVAEIFASGDVIEEG